MHYLLRASCYLDLNLGHQLFAGWIRWISVVIRLGNADLYILKHFIDILYGCRYVNLETEGYNSSNFSVGILSWGTNTFFIFFWMDRSRISALIEIGWCFCFIRLVFWQMYYTIGTILECISSLPLFLLSGRNSSTIFFEVPFPVIPHHPLASRFVMSAHPQMRLMSDTPHRLANTFQLSAYD